MCGSEKVITPKKKKKLAKRWLKSKSQPTSHLSKIASTFILYEHMMIIMKKKKRNKHKNEKKNKPYDFISGHKSNETCIFLCVIFPAPTAIPQHRKNPVFTFPYNYYYYY